MSEADQAYEAALEKIAQVKQAGEVEVQLTGKTFRALDRLPPELAGLIHLQKLTLNRTLISDLTPLEALINLSVLSLEGTKVSDLAPLQALTNLQRLYLDGTLVSELEPLQALVNLQRLYLDDTQVSELEPLQDLTKLHRLYLDGIQVSELTPLQNLTNLQILTLNKTKVRDLAPLRALTNLQTLTLNRTQVSDLAPLLALTNLKRLALDGTDVRDLRPIAGLERHKLDVLPAGLFFRDTQATKNDARIAELALIKDNQARTIETLDYLRRLPPWPKPYTPEATVDGSPPRPIGNIPPPPEQDPALPLVWGDHGFEFLANSIDSDPVTEAALDDLRPLLDDLRRKGNRHDDLYRIASELHDRSAGAVSELNLVKLHLSYQKLRRLHMRHAVRQDPLDDETVSSMEAVFDVLPGVTLADDNVRVLIERQEAERIAGLSSAQSTSATRLLQYVVDPEAPFASEVKDTATEVLRQEIEDRLSGTRGILSRNVTVSVLKFVGGSMAAGALGGPVGNFVYNSGGDLLAYAVTMGDDALFWAQSVLAKFRVEYEIFMGIAQDIPGKISHSKTPSAEKNEGSSK